MAPRLVSRPSMSVPALCRADGSILMHDKCVYVLRRRSLMSAPAPSPGPPTPCSVCSGAAQQQCLVVAVCSGAELCHAVHALRADLHLDEDARLVVPQARVHTLIAAGLGRGHVVLEPLPVLAPAAAHGGHHPVHPLDALLLGVTLRTTVLHARRISGAMSDDHSDSHDVEELAALLGTLQHLLEGGGRRLESALYGHLGAAPGHQRVPPQRGLQVLPEPPYESPGQGAEVSVPGKEGPEGAREQLRVAVHLQLGQLC
mmetsp:Transcript_5247/g.7694  ORF Transcript_5247/g.7694 Transcript_5247/m.7694 type:complete len:258 (+) Transcript_5247:1363-2136(+)